MPLDPQQEIKVRIIVERPVAGVVLRVQRGRAELLEPTKATPSEVVFDFTMRVEPRGRTRAGPNFVGPFAQGPPAARFVYVNVGQMAGQSDSPWSRRAKIPLTEITTSQVEAALRPGGLLEVHFDGQGSDGTPTCATVRLPPDAWQVRRPKK